MAKKVMHGLEKKQVAQQMHQAGKKINDIAQTLKISPHTIRSWLYAKKKTKLVSNNATIIPVAAYNEYEAVMKKLNDESLALFNQTEGMSKSINNINRMLKEQPMINYVLTGNIIIFWGFILYQVLSSMV